MKKVKVRSYCSPTLVLLAFDWPDGAREDFLGFAVSRVPGPAGKPESAPRLPVGPGRERAENSKARIGVYERILFSMIGPQDRHRACHEPGALS